MFSLSFGKFVRDGCDKCDGCMEAKYFSVKSSNLKTLTFFPPATRSKERYKTTDQHSFNLRNKFLEISCLKWKRLP